MATPVPVAPETLLAGGPAPTPAPEPTKTTTAPASVPLPAEEHVAKEPSTTDTPPKPEPGATPSATTAVPTAEPTPAPAPAPASTVEPTPTTTAAPEQTPAPSAAEPAATTGAQPVPAATATTGSAAAPTESEKPAAQQEQDEPQNALTKKFTEAEWKALKEFRAKIPSILEDAYSDSDKPERKTSPITFWGVSIDPSGKANDARASVALMKFLRARNLNPTSAAEMLTATLRWRDEFKIDEVMKEEFPADVFGKLGFVYGKDKHGGPVTYNIYGGNKDLQAIFGDVQRFLRWRVQLMEKSIAELDFETVDQMVQVHDYEGVGMRDRDANSKNAASEATSVFQGHYPEFLSRKYFINVPTLMSWVFWLFKSLVSSQTFAKMSVVGSGQHAIKKALEEVIDDKEIPKRYGGQAEGF